MDTNEIQTKIEKLEQQIEKYDINAVVTGEQYEHERRIGILGHAIETKKFLKIFISQGREIKNKLQRDLETALEATK